MLRPLIDLLVPPTCLACGEPGRDLCGDCRRGLVHLDGRCCARCALPEPCGRRCPAARARWAAAWSPVAYAGTGRALVTALKFDHRTAAVGPMAASLAALAPPGLLAGALVPVPTSRARVRERGFDQAVLLARALGRRTGLPVVAALERHGGATRQVGASRSAREAAVRAGLRARAGGPPPAACVLLDDVHTTGATLRAAARALHEAGARRVVAVTYARTL